MKKASSKFKFKKFNLRKGRKGSYKVTRGRVYDLA